MLSSTQIFATIVLVVCAPGLLSLVLGFLRGLNEENKPTIRPTLGQTVDRAIEEARRRGYQRGVADGSYSAPTWYSDSHY